MIIYTQEELDRAKEMGKVAFVEGIDVPALDPALRRVIKPGSKPGESMSILLAWSHGWADAAALAAAQLRASAESIHTYYVSEAMLGDDATEDDARKMVAVLARMGYTVAYGNQFNQYHKDTVTREDWDAALEQLADELYREQRL